MDDMISDCLGNMEKRIKSFDYELARIRTGRASVSLLDGIRVDYYGAPTPIQQVSSVSTPDARTIVITPFEKKLISSIEKAIQIADLGIQPTNDGNVVRLPIPALTEDRRKDIAKSVRKLGEDAKVGVRRVRQEYNTRIKKLEKSKEINEDSSKELQKGVQKVTDEHIETIEKMVGTKEKEVMSV